MTSALPLRVSICICTFRRAEELRRLLDGLAGQRFSRVAPPNLSVIVADNEPSERTREGVVTFATTSPFPVRYVPEPRRGISQARNACLDALPSESAFFAFIDDDEIPDPDWLDELLWAQAATGADVVQGSVWPVFEDAAVPSWICEGDYFGRFTAAGGSDADATSFPELEQAVTSNVLVRRRAVTEARARFDPAFALTGAEDTRFFMALRASGSRIVLAPHARVREIVPPERTTLGYLVRLKIRDGQNRELTRPPTARAKAATGVRRVKHVWRSAGGHAMSEGLAQVGAQLARGRFGRAYLAEGLLRLAYGFGQLRGAVGWRYEHYRRASGFARLAEPRQNRISTEER